MNREIEFRGKRIVDDTWIYGGYIKTHRTNKSLIGGTSRFCQVKPQTVGQYTGLKDKNGTKIFEGDIVELHSTIGNIHWLASVEFGKSKNRLTYGWQLKLIKILDKTRVKECCWNTDILVWIEDEFDTGASEVIGNNWDNPELLGGSNEN